MNLNFKTKNSLTRKNYPEKNPFKSEIQPNSVSLLITHCCVTKHSPIKEYDPKVQWLRIHLSMQGTYSIPGPGGSHLPWSGQAHASQLLSPRSRTCALQLEKPPQWEAHTRQWRAAPHSLQQEKVPRRSSTAKNKWIHKRILLFFMVWWVEGAQLVGSSTRLVMWL